jgi:hypothetical protein
VRKGIGLLAEGRACFVLSLGAMGALAGCSATIQPTMPPWPGHGWQEYRALAPGFNCVENVLRVANGWATGHGFLINSLSHSEFSVDLELLPGRYLEALDKRLKEFEGKCILFTSVYERNETMRRRLQEYLATIEMQASAVDDVAMAQQGFSRSDAKHLAGHLASLPAPVASLKGFEYIRITYSAKPRSEYAITTGVAAGAERSPMMLELVGSLRVEVEVAATCRRRL